MPKLILAILALILTPLAGWAQAPKDSWENLKQLQPGHKIKVVDKSLKSWSGRLVSVSDEAITIREKSNRQEITVERPNVLRVTDLQRSARARNALIGFVAGSVIGALAISSKEGGEGQIRLVGAGLLGAPGAAIGALVPPGRPTFYRAHQAPGKNTTVRQEVTTTLK